MMLGLLLFISMQILIVSGLKSSIQTHPRVIIHPLPILYIYDHCPFCVRVRLALGLKNVKHELRFLANDDVITPTSLIGKKAVPILEMVAADGSKIVMPESLEIISRIDSDERFGQVNYFRPFSNRQDLKAWQSSVSDLFRNLQRPRYMLTPLPEFQQADAREAFMKNHPLPPYEKDAWQGLTCDERVRNYQSKISLSPELIADANKALKQLDGMIYSPEFCSDGGLSLDDIDLWSRLRSVTLIKGIEYPSKLRKYLDNFAAAGDVPLYDSIAV